MKQQSWQMDDRIKVKHFSWLEYSLTILALTALPVLPAFLYSDSATMRSLPLRYVVYYVIYCGIVAALFCATTAWQKYTRFDRPLHMLCDAARRVAQGDFSVSIPPQHAEEKADSIDVMFMDFNKMVAELNSIETLKNDFVSNVSHEIKTPLAVIRSYVSALQNPDLPEHTRMQYMETVVAATDKLSNLVSNILKLSKLENQKIVARPTTYDLSRQLSECVLGFEELWEKRQIEPVVDIEERVLLTADEGMMEIVWNNLLSNAIKFTPDGGRVCLRQSTAEGFITVQVQDNGCGMSEETMRRIFDKFYQGDTAHSGEGNGLGLALAQRIVNLSGGTLSVESRQGEGSTFTVCLKAAAGGNGGAPDHE